jgi:hypothetical protein
VSSQTNMLHTINTCFASVLLHYPGGDAFNLFTFAVPEFSYTEGGNMLLQNYSNADTSYGDGKIKNAEKFIIT